MKQVLILGAYGQNNLGDEALLEIFIEKFKDTDITVNSAQPGQTTKKYGVAAIRTYRGWPRFSRLRALFKAEFIIFGGGSLLKEIEGSFLKRLLYFVRLLLILLAARLFGQKTIMLGVGIGPLPGPFFKRLARLAARITTLICVRDSESELQLRCMGIYKNVHLTADPVLLLEPVPVPGKVPVKDEEGIDLSSAAPHQNQAYPDLTGRPYVVVIPRYSLTAGQQLSLIETCNYLVEKYDQQIVLVPFQNAYHNQFDDLAMARSFQEKLNRPEAAIVLNPANIREAQYIIGQANLVISTRLHGLICAAIQGTTPVALNYEVKMAGFMAEIEMADYCLDLAGLEQGKLLPMIEQAWVNRAGNETRLRENLVSLRQRARRNFELAEKVISLPKEPRLLFASLILFFGMTIVNAGNYFFNLVLGRWLGPVDFADLSLIITLFLIVTFITATLQTVAAKFSAKYKSEEDLNKLSGVRKWLLGWSYSLGIALFGLMLVSAPYWNTFFKVSSLWPFLIFGISLPFYFAQGVDRGVLQGQTSFGKLALSYQAEMWVRLIVAFGLVALGFSVTGAAIGLSVSILATWWVARRVRLSLPDATMKSLEKPERKAVWAFAGPASFALVGQILINNSDIIIVKHFFSSLEAGRYAALALIGRIVFFATWSVVTALFPIVAQKHQIGEPHRHLLGVALTLVGTISGFIIAATIIFPDLIVKLLFGEAYLSISSMLWLYALATAFFALSNVIISYWLSIDRRTGSILAVFSGLIQVGGLWLWHSSLQEVVLVQVAIMGCLLIVLLTGQIWIDWETAPRFRLFKLFFRK